MTAATIAHEPPATHDDMAELVVLGAILQDRPAAELAAARLTPSDFFRDPHRLVFEAVCDLLRAGQSVDRATVYSHIVETHPSAQVSATLLLDAEAAVPTAAHAPVYVEQLHRIGRKRLVQTQAARLAEAVANNGDDPDAHVRDFIEMVGETRPDAATITRDGDDFRLQWEPIGVEITVSHLRDASDGVQGEITITRHGQPLHWSRLNLVSLSARESLVTKLGRTRSKFDWRTMLEEACRETATRYRQSTPTVELVPGRAAAERNLMDKLVREGEINLLFSDGGSGKSLLALAVAIAVRAGHTLPAGLIPRRHGPVLYLDWESCREEHEERLAGLLAGLRIPGPVPIAYRRMVGALADEAALLRREVAREGAVLVIVDSLVPACGAEPETADATIRAFGALRSFGCASLVLAHVNKTAADARGPARPFGSVFVQNLARNAWELRRAEDAAEDVLSVGLFHRKTNRGRLLPPLGLDFTFGADAIRVGSGSLAQDAGLRERAGLPYSIKAVLRAGGRTIGELAEELEASEESVKKTLGRLEKAGIVTRLSDHKAAPGRPILWGIKA